MGLLVATDDGFHNENSPEHMTDLLVNITRGGRGQCSGIKDSDGVVRHGS